MNGSILRFRKRLIFLVLIGTLLRLSWAHEGEDHSERAAHLEVLKVGPNQLFQVSIAHLPDSPIAGQKAQFLVRLEEVTSSDDPLLGGRGPVMPRSLQVSMSEEGQPAQSLKVEEGGEAGVYRFQHVFSKGGPSTLGLQFENAQGVGGKAEMTIPVKSAPGNWTLLLLQGVILLGCLGLVVQRFVVSPPAKALLLSLLILSVGGAAFALLTRYWPSGVPPVDGELGVEALTPPLEETPELAALPAKSELSEIAYESPPSEPSVLTGMVMYATNRLVQVTNPFPGTIIYKQGAPKMGDWVRSGQVLGTIQNKFNLHDAAHLLNQRWDYVKEILRTKEEKVQAETAYQRATRLFELGIISRRQLQASELRFNAAATASKDSEERLKLHDSQIQQSNLKETEVASPIAGYINRAVYSSGQMIYAGDVLFEIVDLSVVWVEAYAYPQNLQQVQEDRVVTLRSSAFSDRTFQGKLINVRSDTDPTSKAIRVLYEVQNSDRVLKAGMLLSVHLGENGSAKQEAAARGKLNEASRRTDLRLGGE
ncbi:MAG: efflux RND transporter periplasmic adaptor subunit [Acidobacteria bacterium]|nr:efflux RND transporter periplasmic adaptor subunit [Acidobacteriota bacterium]